MSMYLTAISLPLNMLQDLMKYKLVYLYPKKHHKMAYLVLREFQVR